MAELKLRSTSPALLRQIIESALAERLQSLETGLKRTQERLQEFEERYQLSTAEFIQRFNNDEFAHSFEFDEWVGESRMLRHLQEKKQAIEGVEFVN
ncbi:hypothetical protein [Oscillatoria sp. FACHB-1406]|uniref:hypothetical protein n=1 Tax=Oscillatoria sp. FACHB-1406 TaxID=2692846 RepID=UPI0016839AFB|nr:hypothetical protein [Oscillatoria sp. FACHB-1406]MBD2580295.1 hypothetical protein [Oscillatoria sp. FACHB-1406]